MSEEPVTEFEIPPECCVVFYNDDVTPENYVRSLLTQLFNKDEAEAETLTQKIQEEGSYVIGTYTYDIAQTRAAMASANIKKSGFPLKIEVKK